MRKYKTAWTIAKNHGVHDGITTQEAIEAFIPRELWESMRGKDLGLIIIAINAAYHSGRDTAEKNALEEGGVYNSKTGKFQEFK